MTGFINNLFVGFANGIRNGVLTAEARQNRVAAKSGLAMLKLAAVVAVLSTAIFFAIFPNIFTGLILGLTLYGAYEVTNVANNIIEILDNAVLEIQVQNSRESLNAQLGKNAPVCRLILDCIPNRNP